MMTPKIDTLEELERLLQLVVTYDLASFTLGDLTVTRQPSSAKGGILGRSDAEYSEGGLEGTDGSEEDDDSYASAVWGAR